MFMGCSNSQTVLMIRFGGFVIAVIVMVASGISVLLKRVPRISMRLVLMWLLVTMLATGVVPDVICNGQAPWTTSMVVVLLIFVAALLSVCYVTYREIRRRRVP